LNEVSELEEGGDIGQDHDGYYPASLADNFKGALHDETENQRIGGLQARTGQTNARNPTQAAARRLQPTPGARSPPRPAAESAGIVQPGDGATNPGAHGTQNTSQ